MGIPSELERRRISRNTGKRLPHRLQEFPRNRVTAGINRGLRRRRTHGSDTARRSDVRARWTCARSAADGRCRGDRMLWSGSSANAIRAASRRRAMTVDFAFLGSLATNRSCMCLAKGTARWRSQFLISIQMWRSPLAPCRGWSTNVFRGTCATLRRPNGFFPSDRRQAAFSDSPPSRRNPSRIFE